MKVNFMKKLLITFITTTILINLICINCTVNATEYNDAKVSMSEESETNGNEIVKIIKSAIAKWYYIMRLIVIAFMLIVLLFIGIKMAISTIGSEKAVYKRMLMDWIVGMLIVFSIHYIMIFILTVNDIIVENLRPFAVDRDKMEKIEEEYEYGEEKSLKTNSEVETTLYESARTRAYSIKLTDGFMGMIIYAALVYYAWRFAIMYFRRLINIIILTLLAPAVSASYALNKVLTGKAKIFSTWFKEYIMNVIIQIVHVIIYVSFVSIGLRLSLESLPGAILALILLNFMTKADKLFRKIFNMSGGKESLAGGMANSSGFRDIKNEFSSMKNAMIGGTITKAAIGGTYRLATKPFRAVGETALGGLMANKANKEEAQAKENQEEKERLEERQAELEEKREMLKQKEAKLGEEQYELLNMRNEAELEASIKEGEKVSAQLKDIEDEYEINQEALKNRQQAIEIEEMADEYRKQAMKLEFEAQQLGLGGIKGGFKQLFDKSNYIQKGEDGKYHAIRTRREGDIDGAFWRKKKDSVGMRFLKNAKWDRFLGVDSDEKKILKNEFNFFKSSILGIMSSVAGVSMLTEHPMIGMGLLAKGGLAHLNIKTRKRMLKNRAAKINSTSYTFGSFPAATRNRITQEAMLQIERAESKMTKHNMKKHKKLANNIMNGNVSVYQKFAGSKFRLSAFEEEQLEVIYQKKLRKSFNQAKQEYLTMDTNYLAEDYKNQFNAYEQKLTKEAQAQSLKELFIQDKLTKDNVIKIGNDIMEVGTDDAIDEFTNKADEIDKKAGISHEQKITQIQEEINKNQTKLIESAVIKLSMNKGIQQINSKNITTRDIMDIKQNIVGSLEDRGIVKKGEINLTEAGISEQKIIDVCKQLSENEENTKVKMEEEIVQNSLLEYIAKEGITDVSQLKNDEAKDELYDIIKKKLMPDSQKKSADVINQLTGQDKITEEFELSDKVQETLEKKIKKVKKVDISQEDTSKEKLVQRQVDKKLNDTKQRLETAMYTEDESVLDSEDELKLKLLLSQLGEHNIEAEKIKKEFKEIKSETKEKMQYYKEVAPEMMEKNGDLTDELRYIESKIHGPEIDVIDLINNGKKSKNGKAV